MSRSDHTYPSYVKLDIDHQRPPTGWKDGSRRCGACGKNWPNLGMFSPTPCCNAQGGIVSDGTPDVTWPEAVSALLHFRFEKYYDRWNEGVTDEQIKWVDIHTGISDAEMSEGMKEIEQLISKVEGNVKH